MRRLWIAKVKRFVNLMSFTDIRGKVGVKYLLLTLLIFAAISGSPQIALAADELISGSGKYDFVVGMANGCVKDGQTAFTKKVFNAAEWKTFCQCMAVNVGDRITYSDFREIVKVMPSGAKYPPRVQAKIDAAAPGCMKEASSD